MKKIGLILSLLIACQFAICQQLEYVKSFDWMVKTFEENDAGFKFYLEQKGVEDYTKHTTNYREKIQQVKSESEYLQIMNDWLHYFRKGHIGFFPKTDNNLAEAEKDYIRNLYSNELRINLSESEFKSYLQVNKNTIHPVEGIWTYNNYTVGIVRSKNNDNQFDMFIIKADSIYWFPKQLKAKLTLQKNTNFDAVFSMRNHTKENTTAKWVGNSTGIISLMGGYLIKNYPQTLFSKKDSAFCEFAANTKPFLKRLSQNSIYLRIPSFELPQKEAIDKLLARNDQLIKSTKNLIIDIRNGTGSSDYSHNNLFPYYYTQPIRYVGQVYRGTELNALEYEKFATMHKDSSSILNSKNIAKKMREHKGGYYDPGKAVDIYNYFKCSIYPTKVAIICNNNNASADESLLYMARQSYKVKIFGKPTKGAFDFSNVNIVDVPGGKYVMWLAMTASKRFPEYRIDDIGIQPDFFIDDSINEEDWIEFVQSVIEQE
jgi:hypothetical protein